MLAAVELEHCLEIPDRPAGFFKIPSQTTLRPALQVAQMASARVSNIWACQHLAGINLLSPGRYWVDRIGNLLDLN